MDQDELVNIGKVVAKGLLIAAAYSAPALIAACRRHRQAERIAFLNLFLGWTILGWAVLLVWVVWPKWRHRPRVTLVPQPAVMNRSTGQ